MMAVVGINGSGKSSLIRSLSLRNVKGLQINGEIRFNRTRHCQYIKNLIGFIENETMFLPSLTIREHLTFRAKISINFGEKKQEINEKIETILEEVNFQMIKYS